MDTDRCSIYVECTGRYLCFGIGELLTAQISDRLVSNGRFRPGEGGGMSVLGVRTWVPLLTSAAMIGFYTAIAVRWSQAVTKFSIALPWLPVLDTFDASLTLCGCATCWRQVGAVSSKAGIIVLFSGLLWFYGMAALNPFLVANDLFPETVRPSRRCRAWKQASGLSRCRRSCAH